MQRRQADAFSWVIYVACGFLGNDLAQYLISTIIVSAYAEVMARAFKAPVTGFLTIGITAAGAGGGIYYDGVPVFPGRPQFIETGIHTPLPLPVHWQWGF